MCVDFRGISQNIYPENEKTIQTNISSQKQKFKDENKKDTHTYKKMLILRNSFLKL